MEANQKSQSAKKQLLLLIVVLSIGSITYRLLGFADYDHSSLLFVGIPALLSMMIVRFSSKPKNLYGVVFRTVTLFLLISSILLGEGLICVIMAAPIFYGVAGILTYVYKLMDDNDRGELKSLVIIPLILLLSSPFEVGKPGPSYTVTNSRTFDAPLDFTALNESPAFMNERPFFLQMGFPEPVSNSGSGLRVGDQRSITFESSTKGKGELVFEITESEKDRMVFSRVKDDTHIGTWMSWNDVVIETEQLKNGQTQLTWTSNFRCDLGPSWYFGTTQRFAVGLSNEHLMDSYFGDGIN
jgi:hypothetical protein